MYRLGMLNSGVIWNNHSDQRRKVRQVFQKCLTSKVIGIARNLSSAEVSRLMDIAYEEGTLPKYKGITSIFH